MREAKMCGFTASALICVLLLTAGCAQTARLALKFTLEDSTTYKVTTERERSVIWEGPLVTKPKGFIGGHTGHRIEMTFTRRIQSVDDKGNAVAEITIKGLKYLAKVRDDIILDFDSSREKEREKALSKLVGQSYTIEMTPSGQISKVIDVSGARAAVEGSGSGNERAARLLSAEVIKEQHSIPALPAAEKNQLRTGDNWSSIKTFSFDMMGSKSFEKIYRLEKIEDSFFAALMRILRKDPRDHQIAVAGMNAVPSSAKAKQLHKEQVTSPFSKMFDNIETYTGQLRLDLTAGKVEKYFEEFRSEWIALDTLAGEEDKEPDMLRMSAIRLYSIEKID